MKAKQIISDARNLIVERGWAHQYQDSDGCLCLVGALFVAAGYDPYGTTIDDENVSAGADPVVCEAFQTVFHQVFPDRITPSEDDGFYAPGEISLFQWNDSDERNVGEVLAVLDGAAA